VVERRVGICSRKGGAVHPHIDLSFDIIHGIIDHFIAFCRSYCIKNQLPSRWLLSHQEKESSPKGTSEFPKRAPRATRD